MSNKNLLFPLPFIKRNFIFILLLIIVVFLETNINNHQFFVTIFQNLTEYQFDVDQGTVFGFTQVNDQLISEHNDPHITLRNIDDRIRFIKIRCTNPNPEALSQIFFRRVDQDWDEENSITFPLSYPDTTVSLPKTLNVASLRLDLTNREGDVLACQGFTLNSRSEFDLSFARICLLILGLTGMLVGNKFIPEGLSEIAWRIFTADGVWLFILLIVLISLAYPITITYDAAHYLWLADLIANGDWVNWDPIRYPGFPLHIFLSLLIFGYHQNALLYPMILFHVVLYFFSCQILFEVFKFKQGKERFITSFIVFIIIAMDPTVMGYFHTLLTEFYAATIAVVSVWLAIKLYQSQLFSRRFILLSSIILFLVPVAWHIKQPYIGAALFPLIIVTFLILFRQFSIRTLAYGFAMLFIVTLLVVGSTLAWNNFLRAQGNPMPQNRQVMTMLEEKLTDRPNVSDIGLWGFLKNIVDEYLAFSNYYLFSFSSRSVVRSPILGRGNENTMIAHRMFIKTGNSNLYFFSPKLFPHTTFTQTTYRSPLWLNSLFQARMKLSHTLFTLTNLALPIFNVAALFLWIRDKNILNTSLLLLGGSSLMNLIAHLFLIIPNDRYQFWGYIYNLLILSILIIYLLKIAQQRQNLIKQNNGQ